MAEQYASRTPMANSDQGTLLPEPPAGPDIDLNLNDPVWKRTQTFCYNSQQKISEQIDEWRRGDQMYRDCYDTSDDNVSLYNPDLLVNAVMRIIDNLKLADYTVRIPQSDEIERQIINDALTQIEQESGLFSEISDDDKGALSWALLGNLVLWWGKSDQELIDRGIPVTFKSIRLSQAYFDTTFSSIRESNGKPLHNELFIVVEYPYGDVLDMFDKKKNPKAKALTGNTFTWGRLPITTIWTNLQDVENKDLDIQQRITQVGYYYNLNKGIMEVRVGMGATCVEKYDDNDSSCPNYPFKLDNENYLPATLLKAFATLGDLYGKGAYHRFAKIARGDARRRSLAHKYADKNVNPDKFVQMNEDRFAKFVNEVDLYRQIQDEGDDSYLFLKPEEKITVGDLRSAPLSQEFERMKQDDQELMIQGGITLQDTQYANQTATTTLAVEKNKNRLTDHIVKINAGEAAFLRRVMIQFIKDHIPTSNKAPVATNVKAMLKTMHPADQAIADHAAQQGIQPEIIDQFKQKQSVDTGKEVPLNNVTMGDIAEYLKSNDVYVQADFSAWNEIDYQLRLLQMAMTWTQGTPAFTQVQQEALALLGFDVKSQELQQQPGIGGVPGNMNQQAGGDGLALPPQRAGGDAQANVAATAGGSGIPPPQ